MNKRHGSAFSILLAIVIIIPIAIGMFFFVRYFINDQRSFAAKSERDTTRLTHVNTLISALDLYKREQGILPLNHNIAKGICRSDEFLDCKDLANLQFLLSEYLVSIPTDPFYNTGPDTQYLIIYQSGSVTISAPNSEIEEISITRILD